MASQESATLTETFDLLTHPFRRYVLYYLTAESERVDIDALAAALANWDGGPSPVAERTHSDDVEVALRHIHLPKLADAGVVAFDEDTGTIELVETNGHDQFIAEAARLEEYARPVAGD